MLSIVVSIGRKVPNSPNKITNNHILVIHPNVYCYSTSLQSLVDPNILGALGSLQSTVKSGHFTVTSSKRLMIDAPKLVCIFVNFKVGTVFNYFVAV